MSKAQTRKFSHYNKPYPPHKPLEQITEYYNDQTFTVGDYESLDISNIKADQLEVEFEIGYDNSYKCHLTFKHTKLVDNPHYETQLKQYEIDLKNYKTELKWWNSENKKYLAEQAKQAKESRKKQFEQLKKEFGDG